MLDNGRLIFGNRYHHATLYQLQHEVYVKYVTGYFFKSLKSELTGRSLDCALFAENNHLSDVGSG